MLLWYYAVGWHLAGKRSSHDPSGKGERRKSAPFVFGWGILAILLFMVIRILGLLHFKPQNDFDLVPVIVALCLYANAISIWAYLWSKQKNDIASTRKLRDLMKDARIYLWGF